MSSKVVTTGQTKAHVGIEDYLNAYEVLNTSNLRWNVRLYSVRSSDRRNAQNLERGIAKNAFWQLRKKNSFHCHGMGFVLDVNASTIAVPEEWEIPALNTEIDGFVFNFEKIVSVCAQGTAFERSIVEGILREAIKNHFKRNYSEELGVLWQEFNSFCQSPEFVEREEFAFCRRFTPVAKFLQDGRLVLQLNISTVSVDSRTLADYYREGDVALLADRIEAKQANRFTRKNEPIAIHALLNQELQDEAEIRPLELSAVDVIAGHATLTRQEQQGLANSFILCRRFPEQPKPVLMRNLRLVLDTQITHENHDETIIDPVERHSLMLKLRSFLEQIDVYGYDLKLDTSGLACSLFEAGIIRLPTVRVKDSQKGETLINSPKLRTPETLRSRCRQRASAIRESGFLQARSISPLVAAPHWFGTERLTRLASDLQFILKQQGINFRLASATYRDIDELSRTLEEGQFDSALIVLPEKSRRSKLSSYDTHESIKRSLNVPSQCIHHDNTLPEYWASRPHQEFKAKEPRLANRISQRYELCLSNLLVKNHWVPFAPSEAFNYNVHVGIDVGGKYNNTAMVCVAHGLSDPTGDILFLPDEIPIESQKAEPIPTESLYNGLLHTFQTLRGELKTARLGYDFNRALFIRDGHFHGNEDIWNELDALGQLHREFLQRGWIDDTSVWTAVEILKSAEGWRLLNGSKNNTENPIVGTYVFPFEDAYTGLICTTGQPYLHQGTACPLKIRIQQITGESSRLDVVSDLIWEADMCFTKVDMGMRLPWVLNVADTGALQVSRKYQINGIPA